MREIHQRRRDAFRQKWCKRFKDWSWYAVLAEVFLLALWPTGATLALLAGVVLTVLRFRTDRTFKFRQLPLDVPVCLFLLLSGVSILASPDRGFSFYNWYNLVGVYALTYFLSASRYAMGSRSGRSCWPLRGRLCWSCFMVSISLSLALISAR